MANAELQNDMIQLAECIGVNSYQDNTGKARKSFVMSLDGEEFEIPESKYFVAEQGKTYYPVVSIAQVAKISPRTHNPYIARIPTVSWNEYNIL
jgi:hypothetical protein